jgi:hypothetical protein
MQNKAEQAPPHIFDWLGQHDFSSLGDERQAEVLKYFSAEDYEEMHRAVCALLAYRSHRSLDAGSRRKEFLLDHFDSVHQPSLSRNVFSMKIEVWKAAAVFILFATAWMLFSYGGGMKPEATGLLASVDSARAVNESSDLPDTMFSPLNDNTRVLLQARQRSGSLNSNDRDQGGAGEVNIVTIGELENVENRARGNSMKDDSALISRFSFITL